MDPIKWLPNPLPHGTAAIPLWSFRQVVGYALVDASEFQRLNAHRWRLHRSQHICYAMRSEHIPGTVSGSKAIYLHREVMGLKPGTGHAVQIDHLNHNGLDDTKANLRICTHAENQRNRKHFRNNKSGIPGVCYCEKSRGGKWMASVKRDGRWLVHKHFATKEGAVKARDAALALYESQSTQRTA